jgi:hypothetical protein
MISIQKRCYLESLAENEVNISDLGKGEEERK